MRVLIACDKFKGTLSAGEAAGIIRRELSAALPGVEFDLCPIADGGEGTTEAVVTALGGEWVECATEDARGRPRAARLGWLAETRTAVMEMSAASGLAQVLDLPLQPELAGTFGTGLLMRHALEHGAERILMGLGGSATNDGGAGMAAALGFRFLDARGAEVTTLPAHFHRIERVLPPARAMCAVQAACDVDNPLLGPRGATAVYGPQKGVRDAAFFEEGLAKLAETVRRDLGVDFRDTPGAGAAGGLGWGLMVFCGAALTSGFDLVAGHVRLKERMREADLVITGEGRLDAQTLCGKGPVGVAQMARRLGKPVLAYAGVIEDSPTLRECFDLAFASKPPEMEMEAALANAEGLLASSVRSSAERAAALLAGHVRH